VREALAGALETLNGNALAATVCTIAEGVFVPLAEFERRGVQASVAIRALLETGMLVKPSPTSPPTLNREFGGTLTAGVVLSPRFVDGVDPAAFIDAAPAQV
ncbi:relaxase, partial [Cupriavidus basilensis]|nr:relaxase [Cupriavidus basilensis]